MRNAKFARSVFAAINSPRPVDELPERNGEPFEFSAERHANGRFNRRRARALERHARYVYEHDRD
jgi:hypothetical protein